jgi:hypothetical protein
VYAGHVLPDRHTLSESEIMALEIFCVQ